ncbi:hypothetical protein NDU88_002749 [Pleurodeles waltl]|uniref:Uncharacterized protein n=1 Tax=Pleurodeles waltl TaxID=8319 RepID=A0AAV7M1Z2_PLEWA|nr:hypothetical protein NDU88_002749 [Pleurodeles waltl]
MILWRSVGAARLRAEELAKIQLRNRPETGRSCETGSVGAHQTQPRGETGWTKTWIRQDKREANTRELAPRSWRKSNSGIGPRRAGAVRLAVSALIRRNPVEKRAGPKLGSDKIRERRTQESSPPGWGRAEWFRRQAKGSACREGPDLVPVEPEM